MKLTEQQEKIVEEIVELFRAKLLKDYPAFVEELHRAQKDHEGSKEPRRWKPGFRQRYYTRTGFGAEWLDDPVDFRLWENDDVHQTREEAEKVQAMYQAWYKFRALADWKEGLRYVAALYPEGFGIVVLSGVAGMPSFASEESCERAIEVAGRENLKAYLERQEWIWRSEE